MGKVSNGQKKLLAEFSANIGVAWFAGGVIGAFIDGNNSLFSILKSISWGICLAAVFAYLGFRTMNGIR